MKFGKKIILINSIIISILTSIIVIASITASKTILHSNIKNTLIDTVSSRANIIADSKGVVPDSFDYNVGDVYLSIYLSDGTFKTGSFPEKMVDLPIQKGVLSLVKINNNKYYVYDFAISLEGRNDIYLRGMISATYSYWFIAAIFISILAGVLMFLSVFLNIFLVKRTIKPIDKMREEVNEISQSKDIKKRLTKITDDNELAKLADDYNLMLDALEGMFLNHERFTSDVAHELRTPLTVIISESEYALQETNKINDKNESLAIINRQAMRLKSITDSLLEFTRFANKLSIELKPINISKITINFINDYHFIKNISCKQNIEKDLIIYADNVLYERILQNLIDNSNKYGKENGHINITLSKESNKVILKIEDDGIGMSKEALDHAFDRFYREESSRSDKNGLGLGLSLVKEIVRLLNAKIDISSIINEGTCITITFNN